MIKQPTEYQGLAFVNRMFQDQKNAELLLTEYGQRQDIWNDHPLGQAMIAGHVALLRRAEQYAGDCQRFGLLPLAWEGTTALTDGHINASGKVAA